MALKTPHVLLIILWLFLSTLLFHELYDSKAKIISNSTTNSSLSHRPPISRKVLSTKFDFTPFLKHRHHGGRKHPREPAESEIDPRYGVEKRLVPTGPNPLHH